MAANPQYEKTLVDRVLELLKEQEFGNFFRTFYYGDPIDIPLASYPCIAVELVETKVEHGPTGTDKITQTLEIKLMYNKRDDFGKDPSEIYGVRKLEEYAQGLDPVSGQYDSRSIAGIIRKNFTLGNIATNQQFIIDYGISPRPNDSIAAEARITFIVEQLRQVDNRV